MSGVGLFRSVAQLIAYDYSFHRGPQLAQTTMGERVQESMGDRWLGVRTGQALATAKIRRGSTTHRRLIEWASGQGVVLSGSAKRAVSRLREIGRECGLINPVTDEALRTRRVPHLTGTGCRVDPIDERSPANDPECAVERIERKDKKIT